MKKTKHISRGKPKQGNFCRQGVAKICKPGRHCHVSQDRCGNKPVGAMRLDSAVARSVCSFYCSENNHSSAGEINSNDENGNYACTQTQPAHNRNAEQRHNATRVPGQWLYTVMLSSALAIWRPRQTYALPR
jgi:hypothetical protein